MKSLYVSSNYLVNDSVHGRVLSADQCRQIISSSLEVLERTGVDVLSDKALKLFAKSGCWVEGKRVRFPAGLVEWAIGAAPSRVVIADREGDRKLFLEGSNSYFGPGGANVYYIDPLSGERRKPLKRDKEIVGRLCDALPNIDFVMELGAASDVAATLAGISGFEALVRNTSKPIVLSNYSIDQCKTVIEMGIEVAGSLERLQQSPFIVFCCESASPGTHDKESLGKAMWLAEKRLPQVYSPSAVAKETCPATMAGVLVEALSGGFVGLVAAQLVRKGAPFILGGIKASVDSKNGQPSYGSAEFNLLQGAMAKLGQHLEIPVFGTAGCSDSKETDGQMAIEAALSIVTTGLTGANLIHGVGYIEKALTGSLFQLVLCDEVISYTKRMLRGIEVDDDTLAVEVINNVGPGGHFLGEMHTVENFKREFWFPTLMDRTRYDEWKMKGALTMGDRVRSKTQRLIKEHQPKALNAEVAKKIAKLVIDVKPNEKKKKR